MITVGVDLAAEPAKTAACRIDWGTGHISMFPSGVTDSLIVELSRESNVVGIDVPLGWPQDFVQVVAAHQAGESWTAASAGTIEARQTLRFRTTDLHLRERGHRPLSVSTELIGVVALRAAHLQHLVVESGMVVDRSGVSGALVEVYPAAALRTWGLPARGYKGAANAGVRRDLVSLLLAESGALRPHAADHLVDASDHALDAFVSAVVAAASRVGMTEPPSGAKLAAARAEGWIHIPTAEPSDIVAAAVAASGV